MVRDGRRPVPIRPATRTSTCRPFHGWSFIIFPVAGRRRPSPVLHLREGRSLLIPNVDTVKVRARGGDQTQNPEQGPAGMAFSRRNNGAALAMQRSGRLAHVLIEEAGCKARFLTAMTDTIILTVGDLKRLLERLLIPTVDAPGRIKIDVSNGKCYLRGKGCNCPNGWSGGHISCRHIRSCGGCRRETPARQLSQDNFKEADRLPAAATQ